MKKGDIMKLSESKTLKNLREAFLAESGAYTEYEFYAEQAKNDGYQQIYRIFTTFAQNEKAHAEIWFKLYHEIAGTSDNLKSAADLENYERVKMYANFAETAKKEGFDDIADLFTKVGEIEGLHEQTYGELKKKVDNKKVFISDDENTVWKCANCGHEYVGKDAPEQCPVCSYPKAFFYVKQR